MNAMIAVIVITPTSAILRPFIALMSRMPNSVNAASMRKPMPPPKVAAIDQDDEKHRQGAARAKLDTPDCMHRSEIAHGKYNRCEKNQPGYETGEDAGRGPQQQKCPDQPADETQNEHAEDAEFGDREDIAAIRPCARKRSGEQGDDARGIGIDRIEPGEQQGWKCHQGSAAGERVQGSAEERGGNEEEGGHGLCGLRWEAVDVVP